MDTFLALASKREVRQYADRALPEEVRRRILEAGRVSGSSQNRQRRRFIALESHEIVGRAAECVHVPSNLLGAALVVSCPNGVADAERMAGVLGLREDERAAILVSFGYPARRRDPEARPADEWLARADRRPFD